MYFPYLKARGEEANALVGTICSGNNYNNVIPIIEPRDLEEEGFYNGFNKIVENFIDQRKRFICIVNDETDLLSFKNRYGEIFDECCIYGFLNSFPEIQNFKYGAVLHFEGTNIVDNPRINFHIFMPSILQSDIFYAQNFPIEKSVYITDAFYSNCNRNADYPPITPFNNSQLHFRYKEVGAAGFGDFTILKESFLNAGGGNQNYITHIIHLTREFNNKIDTNHFLTTPIDEPILQNRSIETIMKAYSQRNHFFQSEGIIKLIEIYNRGTSTSLGMYKRIGIMHHISLMNNIVSR